MFDTKGNPTPLRKLVLRVATDDWTKGPAPVVAHTVYGEITTKTDCALEVRGPHVSRVVMTDGGHVAGILGWLADRRDLTLRYDASTRVTSVMTRLPPAPGQPAMDAAVRIG